MMQPVKKGLIFLINIYRKFISPILPDSCRFTPTCSQYAITAIEKHGAGVGSVLALRRILRCHPFSKGGWDPVPEKSLKKRRDDG